MRDREVRQGPAPLPFHTPPLDREERRGAHRQSEKSGDIHQGMFFSWLARLRPGARERDVTTSIHRQEPGGEPPMRPPPQEK